MLFIIIIINEKINVAFSQEKLQGHVTHTKNDDVFRIDKERNKKGSAISTKQVRLQMSLESRQ